jgi:hypothetical protein
MIGTDRGGLGFVAFEAADLEREAVAVDQQTDHDLRVDAAFFGVADLAQVVFLFCLEVESRDVVEAQRHIAAGQDVLKAGGRDPVAVTAADASGQGAAHRLVTGRFLPQIDQDTSGVQDRGRLDDAGDHQITKRLVPDRPEPQRAVDLGEHVEQQPRRRRDHLRGRHPWLFDSLDGLGEQRSVRGGCDQPCLPLRRLQAQVELTLTSITEQPTSTLEQQTQLGLGVRRAHVRHDPPASIDILSDLHSRRTRGRSHPPHPRHDPTLEH